MLELSSTGLACVTVSQAYGTEPSRFDVGAVLSLVTKLVRADQSSDG